MKMILAAHYIDKNDLHSPVALAQEELAETSQKRDKATSYSLLFFGCSALV